MCVQEEIYKQPSMKMARAINRQFTEEIGTAKKHENILRNLAGKIKNGILLPVHVGKLNSDSLLPGR